MKYMLVRHRVADYERWRCVFDSDAGAQGEAGLHPLHVFRDLDDLDMVTLLLRVDDVDRARAFTDTPGAAKTGAEAGVVGEASMWFLTD